MRQSTPNIGLTYETDKNNTFSYDNDIKGNLIKVDDEFEKVYDRLDSGITNTQQLTWGYNNIHNNGDTPISPRISLTGMAYTNLLGKDGNFESLTNWFVANTTEALDTSSYVFASNGVKITLTSSTGNVYQNVLSKLSAGKYYLISCYLKNSTLSGSGIGITLNTDDLTRSSSFITSTSGFTRVGALIAPTDFDTATYAYLRVILYGSSTQYGYADGFMLNEISASDYALGVDACLAKYPYVDSYAALQNPYFEVRRDNLVLNGNGEYGVGYWTPYNSNASVIIENGKFKVTSTSGTVGIWKSINVKANTNYYISANLTNGSVTPNIQIYDQNFSTIIRSGVGTFNSGSNSKIYIYAYVPIGYGYFDSIMLIEGTTAPSEYKSCDRKRFLLEGLFTADDTLTLDNGQLTGQLWWKHRTLFGKDYDWQYSSVYTGYKRLLAPICAVINSSSSGNGNTICVKYDGKLIAYYASSPTTYDQGFLQSSTGNIYLSVADTDTGWAESIAPNADEVKTFMNGWKAICGASVNSRYICWLSVVDGSVPTGTYYSTVASAYSGTTPTIADASGFNAGDSVVVENSGTWGYTTISSKSGNQLTLAVAVNISAGGRVIKADPAAGGNLVTWCKNNVAPSYQGYQLHYKLANPEPVTDANTHINGDIWSLESGDNYVMVDSGIVLGEVANPIYYSAYTLNALINTVDMGGNPYSLGKLKFSAEDITSGYKNRMPDTQNWVKYSDQYCYGSSKARYAIPSAVYDSNATYTVDYQILKTLHAQSATLLQMDYGQGIIPSVENIAKELEEKQQVDSALDTLIDLSTYETGYLGDSNNGIYFRASRYYSGGVTNNAIIRFFIPMTWKKTIPVIGFAYTTIVLFDDNGVGVAISPSEFKSYCIPESLHNNSFILEYMIPAGTKANYAINNGGRISCNWVADCRGRI